MQRNFIFAVTAFYNFNFVRRDWLDKEVDNMVTKYLETSPSPGVLEESLFLALAEVLAIHYRDEDYAVDATADHIIGD